jgi:hypothetical protein
MERSRRAVRCAEGKESRMSIRAWVPAVAGLLLLSEFTAARAQPAVPVRPRSSPFGNILGSGFGGSPYLQQQQQRLQQSQQYQLGQQQGSVLAPNSLYYNSQFGGPYLNSSGALPQFLPGASQLIDPTQLQQTGVVGSFNTTNNYFSPNLGHWYPGGYRGGQGVLAGGGGIGGGIGGGFALGGGRGAGGPNGGLTGGMRGGPAALLNSGFMAGATMNQFRR